MVIELRPGCYRIACCTACQRHYGCIASYIISVSQPCHLTLWDDVNEPVGAAICAFDPSSRRSHRDTVPFSPAVHKIELDASNAFAQVMLPCAVCIVFRGPRLRLVGLKRVRCWSDEMAASPPATVIISRT